MVAQYDDDDIIEDYEELNGGEQKVRRVNSAQGGPVRRPSNGVKPTDSVRPGTSMQPALDPNDPNYNTGKGKISHKSARNIWIICIAITVLGVGAVLADVVFDVFGRHEVVAPPENNDVADNRRSGTPPAEMTPRQKLEDEYTRDVIAKMREVERSKAWDFYWTSVQEFETEFDKAVEVKKKDGSTKEERQEAWAKTITQYYKAKYAAALFRHHFGEGKIPLDYLPIKISDPEEVGLILEEHLKDDVIRQYQAAISTIDRKGTNVNKFYTDVLKYDTEAGEVDQSDEFAEQHFGEWKERWKAATAPEPSFVQEHLDFVNGPNYGPDEKPNWQKYLEEKEGG